MKPGKALLLLWAFFLFLCGTSAGQTGTGGKITLQQCVEIAIKNNLPVKQSELQMQTSAITLNQAKGNMIPQLGGNISHSISQGRNIDPSTNGYVNQEVTSANYSLSSNVIVFNGLRLLNALKRYQYAYEASKMEWQQSKDKLTLDVMLAYLQVLTNEDLLDQATRQVEVTRKQVDRLDILNQNGAIKPADLYDVKGQLANDQLTIVNTQNSLDAARLSLAQLMNVPYDSALQVERIGVDQFSMNYDNMPDSIYQVAMQQLAIIKAVDLRKKSAEKEVKAAKGNLIPSLGLNGGVNTTFSSTIHDNNGKEIPYYNQLSNNYGTYIGAGINIPILNNFFYRNQVRLAKIDLKNTEYIAQTSRIQLKQNIDQDYFNMKAAMKRYRALSDQIAAYTESFRAVEVSFNAGASTSVDYVIAKNHVDGANTNLIVARYDYLLRTKILDFYQGKPIW